MIPRKSSMSKKTIGQPKFILKEDNILDSSYLEMYQQNKSHNPGQRLQQILQKQINQSQKNKSVEDDRLTRQQFINRSQQVVRQDLGSYTPQNIQEKRINSQNVLQYQHIIEQIRKLQLDLQQSKHQNQLLIQDFEQLRDQLEKQSEEFNQAFELINEEKQLIQQEIDQKDQIIASLRQQLQQLAPPSKTQMQIDEIKNRILARKSVHRSSRENITPSMNDMDQSARQDFKENFMDFNNRITLQKSIK
ncbi:unnamed protein product (macronuclear) [Paramecium tetraurelia]|uniref:Uncharacterized protein n=1 Tax=Paramecium tetraurelia TaxID=5888 RepID=A0CDU4_PARTE|nr:uncharacterized protein GSPATT00007173001 [Paramecium tetraurelia]CAK68961.1 unnamed protein product [Paramecium tetraurelia]|eukprot:XP_001436358.1 hypothetical protein (macronuclear) [Paramecium tetraurelia strain d4-2]